MYAVAMETMFGLLDYPTLHNNGGAMYPCIGCWGAPNFLGALCPKEVALQFYS